MVLNKEIRIFASWFHPFLFVMVMGTGIASNLLFNFPYEARWLRICSYPMFGLAVLLLLYFHLLHLVHLIVFVKDNSWKAYMDKYFRDTTINGCWGTYPMGFITIINYIFQLARNRVESRVRAKHMIRLAYVMWWYILTISLLCAWGITYAVWQKQYKKGGKGSYKSYEEKVIFEQLNTSLLLIVIPLVVASSCGGLLTSADLFPEAFNRNIHLMTIVITMLTWLHSLGFVALLFAINFWNLYVNKLPSMLKVFTIFLFLGPMGQGAYGINLITENIRLYVERNYPTNGSDFERDVLLLAVPWCFKIIGLILALLLLAFGYFFTVIGFVSIASYLTTSVEATIGEGVKRRRIYNFHRGWFAMTFPMGTMSLGSTSIWDLYNDYVPMKTFRVLGAIYAVISIFWTLVCLTGTVYQSILPKIKTWYTQAHDKGQETDATGRTSKELPITPSQSLESYISTP
ncbi:SSU1 (YPL092W) [Zygosaccharomyces parabailii]|nr:SSU1 (YPL092W) [Zygosaccharomyces parabailii]